MNGLYGCSQLKTIVFNKKKVFKIKINCLNCNKEIVTNYKKRKYCSIKCQQEYERNQWIKKWLSGEINGYSSTDHWGNIPDQIRNYLFEINNNKCSKCGWGEINQFTGLIPLEVDYKDGNYKNNRPENLDLLCPNCHALTKNYRGANKGKGRRKTWFPNIDKQDLDC